MAASGRCPAAVSIRARPSGIRRCASCTRSSGVLASIDDVLGTLDDYPTRSGYLIAPVVVWLGGAIEIKPNPGEVAAAYRIRCSELFRPTSRDRRHPRIRPPDHPPAAARRDGERADRRGPLPVQGSRPRRPRHPRRPFRAAGLRLALKPPPRGRAVGSRGQSWPHSSGRSSPGSARLTELTGSADLAAEAGTRSDSSDRSYVATSLLRRSIIELDGATCAPLR